MDRRRSTRLSTGLTIAETTSAKRRASSESDFVDGDSPRAKKQVKYRYGIENSRCASRHSAEEKRNDVVGLASEESTNRPDDTDDGSEFGNAETAASSPEESIAEEEDEDDDFTSEDEQPKRNIKRRSAAGIKGKPKQDTSGNKSTPDKGKGKGKELWREGVETGLEPGVEVIIKKPKARPAGKIPYKDETIHPNTMLFLSDLKKNNDREWLKMHDPDFRASEKDFKAFIEKLGERLVEIDDTIPELPVKDVIYRIYRDVRFSTDHTPYKPYFSAAWSRTGRKGPYAHYYVQIAPGNSFIGGGCWHPEAAYLARIRNSIGNHPERIRNVLSAQPLRSDYLPSIEKASNGVQKTKKDKSQTSDDQSRQDKVVDTIIESFINTKSNKESALKTAPKGWDKEHKDIKLLRLRSFTIGRKIMDDDVVDEENFMKKLEGWITSMKPFIHFLNGIILPDENDDESDDSSDGSQNQEDSSSESSGAESE